MITGLEHPSYEDRLRQLKMEMRRLLEDHITP